MIEFEDLYNEAVKAMKKSYVPFTSVKVGAAILTKRNKCYTGYTSEFVSMFNSNTAERMAFKAAFDKGDKEVTQIVIVSNTSDFPYPSGISRQMIYDLAKDAKIMLVNSLGEARTYTINDLLPYTKDLNKMI